MKRRAQRAEREDVATPGAPVDPTTAPRVSEQTADPVVLIDELARLLHTSTRTIDRQLRAGTFFIEEMPRVDHRHRWSRQRVLEAIASDTRASHAARLLRARMRPSKAS